MMNRKHQASAMLTSPFVVLIVVLIASSFAEEASAQLESGRAGQALIFPTNRPIEGRVIDPNGIPILGAVVSHFADSSEGYRDHSMAPFKFANSVSTDPFGKFTLENLNSRRGRVCVIHPNFEPRFVTNLSLHSDIVLTMARSVSGRILDHLGEPVKGARFRPTLIDIEDIGFKPPEYLSDADGQVNLKGISQGEGGSYLFVEAETKAGPFHARFIWYPSKASQMWTNPTPGTLETEGDPFEVRLPKPDPVTLEFVEQESGQPVMIESAEFWTQHTRDSPPNWRQKELPFRRNVVEFGFLRPGLNYISITMKPESMIPNQLVVLERVAGAKPLVRQRMKVVRGAKITGRVVEKGTGLPIADAAVAYLPSNPAAQLRNGILTPKFVRSDQHGNFELVVSAARARVRIEGECGVFLTPPVGRGFSLSMSLNSSEGPEIDRSKLLKDFERGINPEPGETVALPVFELERSKVVRGIVVDQQGVPVGKAEYLVALESCQSYLSPIYGTTNEQGEFELDNVLWNALTDLPARRRNHQVLFWDRDRTLLGQVEFSAQTDSELVVVLKPANAVLGRVVDGFSGKPIAGAMVTMSVGNNLKIGAQSAKDGRFLLEFVNQDGASFGVTSPEYTRFHSRVRFDPGQVLKEIDDIVITARDAYGQPERVPDVASLSIDDALSLLAGYLQTELTRIPETQPDYHWNDAEPQFVFKKKVAAELNDTVEGMLERFPDSKDQVRLALMVFEQLNQDRASKMIPFSTTTNLLYSEVILKNMDNPIVLEAEKNFSVQWSSPTHESIVLKNSQTDAAKLWAVNKILTKHSRFLMGLKGPARVSDERFESAFQNIKLAWFMGLNEFSEELHFGDYPPEMRGRIKGSLMSQVVLSQLRKTQKLILERNQDQSRAARVQALIDLLTHDPF